MGKQDSLLTDICWNPFVSRTCCGLCFWEEWIEEGEVHLFPLASIEHLLCAGHSAKTDASLEQREAGTPGDTSILVPTLCQGHGRGSVLLAPG